VLAYLKTARGKHTTSGSNNWYFPSNSCKIQGLVECSKVTERYICLGYQTGTGQWSNACYQNINTLYKLS